MKTGSGVLYTIGQVINVLEMIACAVFVIIGVVCLTNTQAVVEADTSGQLTLDIVRTYGTAFLIIGIVLEVICIGAIVGAGFAKRALREGKGNNVPHIIMLIVGILSGDLFYLIGAILGLTAKE